MDYITSNNGSFIINEDELIRNLSYTLSGIKILEENKKTAFIKILERFDDKGLVEIAKEKGLPKIILCSRDIHKEVKATMGYYCDNIRILEYTEKTNLVLISWANEFEKPDNLTYKY